MPLSTTGGPQPSTRPSRGCTCGRGQLPPTAPRAWRASSSPCPPCPRCSARSSPGCAARPR
eukprot:7603135-Alexandrium_andersonii.AAC.1